MEQETKDSNCGIYCFLNRTGVNNNIDLQNIQSISQNISTITSVPADGLRLAVGVSNGGAFAITVGAALSFDAVNILCGVGRETVLVQT